MAERSTTISTVFVADVSQARKAWEDFKAEVEKNPLRVQIEATNARLSGASGRSGDQTTFGGSGTGAPFVNLANPVAPSVAASSQNIITIRQAAHAAAQANAAQGMDMAGVGGVRVVGQNSVYAGDMSSWLAGAKMMPSAMTAPAVITKAMEPVVNALNTAVKTTRMGEGDAGPLPRGVVNRTRETIDRLSILGDMRTPAETATLRRAEYAEAARRANRANASDADRERFSERGAAYDVAMREANEWARLKRGGGVGTPAMAQQFAGPIQMARGYTATMPGTPPPAPEPGGPAIIPGNMGRFGRFVTGAGLSYFAIQAAESGLRAQNAYQMSLATASSGMDVANAMQAQSDAWAGSIPIVGGLGVKINESLTGARASMARQARMMQVGEQVGDTILAGTRQRVLTGLSIQQSALSGAGLQYSAEAVGIEQRRRAGEFVAKGQYDPQIQALETERSKVSPPQIPVVGPQGGVVMIDDPNSPEYKQQQELKQQANRLRKERDAAIELANVGAIYEAQTLDIKKGIELTTLGGQQRSAVLQGAFQPFEATLNDFAVQRQLAEEQVSRGEAAGNADDMLAGTARIAVIDAAREAFQKQSVRESNIGILQGRAGLTAMQGQISGFGMQSTLAAIEISRQAQQLATPIGGPGEREQREIIDRRARLEGEAARIAEQRAQIQSAGFVSASGLRIGGNPLGAQLAGIRAGFEARVEGLNAGSPEFARAAAERAAQEAEARFGFQFSRTQTGIGLRGEAMSLQRQLQRDFVGAGAFQVAAAGSQRVRDLMMSDMGSEAELARQNTLGQLAVNKQEYLLGFRATQFDAFNISPFNPRNAQNPDDVMNAFGQAVDQVRSATVEKGKGGGGMVGIDEKSMKALADQIGQAIETRFQSLINNGE